MRQYRRLQTSTCGFTLVELLIVVAIMGLLLQLLLSAVVAAREAARKTECKSNLRQLAQGCLLHEEQRGHFPVGRFYGPADDQSGTNAPSWSWMAHLLPYVEQQAIYDEGRIPIATHAESGICHRSIALFLCPSIGRRTNSPKEDRGGMGGLTVALTNYHGVSGANWGADESQEDPTIDTDWRNPGTNGSYDGLNRGDGMLYRSDYRSPRQLRHLTDGASNTLLLGEVHPVINNRVSWPYANNAYSTCAIPPNLDPKDDGRHEPNWWENIGGFRSKHPGGLQFALVDGSVHFVSDDVDLDAYRAMATIAGSETATLKQ